MNTARKGNDISSPCGIVPVGPASVENDAAEIALYKIIYKKRILFLIYYDKHCQAMGNFSKLLIYEL